MLFPVVMPAQSSPVSCSCRSLCPLREAVLAFLLAMVLVPVAPAQDEAPKPANRVLDLDGEGSHVELPASLLNGLSAATVEGWVVLDRVQAKPPRFFDFGEKDHEFYLSVPRGKDLKVLFTGPDRERHRFVHAAGPLDLVECKTHVDPNHLPEVVHGLGRLAP